MNDLTDMAAAVKEANARIAALEAVICSALDNLGDLPVSEQWLDEWYLNAAVVLLDD